MKHAKCTTDSSEVRDAEPVILNTIRKVIVDAEALWFDVTRGIETRGFVSLKDLTLVGESQSGGFDYLPVRARNVRQALKDLPAINRSEYTFVDLGSGKGRVLFLAAEHSFHRVEGIEFAVELHAAAQRNIQRYRCRMGASTEIESMSRIESINGDASDYSFPPGNLVVHMFNPFEPSVLAKVLENLEASVKQNPRHVILILMFPEFASVLKTMPVFRPYRILRRYHIYEMQP
jgi:hypothetical protein